MSDNLNFKLENFYVEISKINDSIYNQMLDFITKANELVEYSNDDYQIEKTFKLNKISLKGFILKSDLCKQLNEKNIDYSIDELKNYLNQYQSNNNIDCSKYFMAISLYELIIDIEDIIDSKIEFEINKFVEIIPNIGDIKNVDILEKKEKYYNLKNQLDNNLKSSILNQKSYEICIQTLNDVFNYNMNGYPNIPDEYLYHMDNL